MDFLSLLTVIAFLVIAADMSGRDRHPVVMLAGLLLLAVSVLLRLAGGDGFFGTLTTLFLDVGISLLVTALWLRLRRAKAKPMPFVMLGLTALGLAGLLYLAAALLGHSTAAPSEDAPTAAEASFLLELGPDDRIEEVAPLLTRYGARYERAFPEIDLADDEDLAQVFLVAAPAADLETLLADLDADAENVDHLTLNTTITLAPPVASTATADLDRQVLENDPLVDQQWGLDAIHGHEAHALLQDLQPARKARIAIVDTGVDAGHEDIRTGFRQSPAAADGNGHGTHCAGIAGAVTNNGLGVASLNWEGRFVEVTAFAALDATGTGTLEQITQAVLDAARDDADVISMSLGSVAPFPPKPVVDAIRFAQRRGTIVVASAGNSNEDATTHFPSNIANVIAVAALDQDLRKAKFSNTIGSLSRPIAAPGVDILSLKAGGGYKPLSGTSMATPVVAGLLGVMRALDPSLSAFDAYRILHETGTPVSETADVGRLINAEAALQAVMKGAS